MRGNKCLGNLRTPPSLDDLAAGQYQAAIASGPVTDFRGELTPPNRVRFVGLIL